MRFSSLAILVCALAAPAAAQAGGASAVVPQAEPDFSALAEYFPDGMPSLLTPQSMTSSYRLPPNMRPPEKKSLPTRIEYAEGSLKWDVNTSVTPRTATTSIVPVPKDPYIAGGAAGAGGEVKGQVRYSGSDWELYGIQSFGSYQGDGVSPTFHDTTVFGSVYRLPAWSAGARIGASFETNSADYRKARIEYRQPLGGAEGFVAAEQFYAPGTPVDAAPASVRAGVNRKF